MELLTAGAIYERQVPANEEAIMVFIRTYGSVAPIEIKMAFDLTDADLQSTVGSLLTQQMISRREAGNGYFISPITSSMACDAATGICAGV